MSKSSYRTLRETVVDTLRKKILNHELQPGERMIEQDISKELGVSRGPIREAFRQLEQEGLVEYTRNVGCSVRQISFQDLYEVFSMRCACELLAIRSFKGTLSNETKEELANALDKMDKNEYTSYDEAIKCDEEFHRIMVSAPGLKRLLKSWEDLAFASFLNRSFEPDQCSSLVRSQYETHKKIYDVYCSGDINAMCEVTAEHYMSALNRRMEQQGLDKDSFRFSMNMLDSLIK